MFYMQSCHFHQHLEGFWVGVLKVIFKNGNEKFGVVHNVALDLVQVQ